MCSSWHRTRPGLTGLKLREVYKLAGSPDAEHRTVRCSPVSYPESIAKAQNTGLKTPDAPTGFNLRLVPSVWCLTLAEPDTAYTPDAQTHCSVPLGQCPVSVSRDFSNFPIGIIEKLHFIFSKKR